MTKLSLPFRLFNISLACVQNMTMGGILFGWASISGSLLLSNVEDGGPGLTSQYVNAIFVIATFFSCLGPLLLGAVLDHYGPRVCSIVSTLFVMFGLVMFGLSDIISFPMFIPAMSMVAFGGPGVQNAIIHLSNLFPGWKATATAVMTGSFQLSFVVFFIFDQLWVFRHWTYRQLFFSYCVVCIVNIVISVFLWPDIPYHHEDHRPVDPGVEDENIGQGDGEISDHFSIGLIRLPSLLIKRTYSMLRSRSFEEMNALHDAKTAMHRLSLKEQIFSDIFLKLTLFFIVNSFWANFYVGTMDIQLGDSNRYDAIGRQNYDRIFTLAMTGGFLSIPIVGMMMDHLGFPITCATISTFGLLWSLCLLSESETFLIPSFIFYSLFRTFLFAFLFAYAADTMGFKYYGILVGIMFVISGFSSLLQYPFAKWAMGTCHETMEVDYFCKIGSWSTVNVIQVFSMIFSFIFAFEDWRRRRLILKKVSSSRANLSMINMDSTNSSAKTIVMMKSYGSV